MDRLHKALEHGYSLTAQLDGDKLAFGDGLATQPSARRRQLA